MSNASKIGIVDPWQDRRDRQLADLVERMKSTENPRSWEEWKAKLLMIEGGLLYGEKGPINATGVELWRGYFIDGFSPAEALTADNQGTGE